MILNYNRYDADIEYLQWFATANHIVHPYIAKLINNKIHLRHRKHIQLNKHIIHPTCFRTAIYIVHQVGDAEKRP
jgi:hypothetical protein